MTADPKRVASTADHLAHARFKPHGRIDLWQEDRVVYYEATGPFNVEVFDCLAIAQLDFLKAQALPAAWASICTVRNSAMATPDGIQRYTELMQHPKPVSMEPIATAFVLPRDLEGAGIMEPHFRRIYQLIARPVQFFETLEQAQGWVHAMLADSPLRD